MRKIFFSFFGLLLVTNSVQAINPQHYFPHSTAALYAQNLNTGKVILSDNIDAMLQPASTQKILTAIRATHILGPSYTINTEVFGKQEGSSIKGDLTFIFRGDPSFGRNDLNYLVKQIKAKGIRKVTGNIVINTGIYEGHDRPTGWNGSNFSICFSSENGAAQYNYGCIPGTLMTNLGVGKDATFKYNSREIKVDTSVKIVSPKADDSCEVNYITTSKTSLTLEGCIAYSRYNKWMSLAVPNTNEYTALMVRNALRNAGISFKDVRVDHSFFKLHNETLLASNRSLPVKTLVEQMINKSENHIAEQLFRHTAYFLVQKPINYTLAAKVNKEVLSNLGFTDQYNAVDGSGLSYYNLISARFLAKAMKYIYQEDRRLGLLSAFNPQGGIIERHKAIKNYKILAKTGSFYGTNNMVGIVKNRRGEDILFVYMINNHTEEDVDQAVYKFEKDFFSEITR